MHLLYEAVEPFLAKQREFGVQLEDPANQIYIAVGVDRAFGTSRVSASVVFVHHFE